MTEAAFQLARPPIVEAVIDIDCDMPPGFDLAGLEEIARDAFNAQYPITHRQYRQQHKIEQRPGEAPEVQADQPALHALQFRQNDERQLIQVRMQGYSFNRLAPYSSIDEYLPEILRTWNLYVKLAKPIQVRSIRLRYINRILLPCCEDGLELNHYFKVCPRLPDEDRLFMTGFINQHSAVEEGTGRRITIVLASQPKEGETAPVIFDISVEDSTVLEPDDLSNINEVIQQLRDLKNRIFRETLEEACLDMFRH